MNRCQPWPSLSPPTPPLQILVTQPYPLLCCSWNCGSHHNSWHLEDQGILAWVGSGPFSHCLDCYMDSKVRCLSSSDLQSSPEALDKLLPSSAPPSSSTLTSLHLHSSPSPAPCLQASGQRGLNWAWRKDKLQQRSQYPLLRMRLLPWADIGAGGSRDGNGHDGENTASSFHPSL